jgi:hypothetical protein
MICVCVCVCAQVRYASYNQAIIATNKARKKIKREEIKREKKNINYFMFNKSTHNKKKKHQHQQHTKKPIN